MPDEVPMVTSCPLCLAADEVSSMVTVEIDRRIGGGRTVIMICRNCTGAVIRAVANLDPGEVTALLTMHCQPEFGQFIEQTKAAIIQRGHAAAADETQAESAQLHDGEEPDDGKATD